MSNEVAALEAEEKEYRSQLEAVQAGILADPSNLELQNLKAELEEVITLTSSAIAELKPASAAVAAPASTNSTSRSTKPTTISEPEKWSKANHPAYQAGYKPPASPTIPQQQEEEKAPTFSVNDSVLAKWKSGDRGFYPARITSITGSSTNPVYIVTFKSYATTETLSLAEIRPLSSSNPNKRKDAPTSTSSSTTATSSTSTTPPSAGGGGGIISKTSTVDSSLLPNTKKEPSKVSDGPTRPAKIARKVKANKELEAGKSKWQQFSAGGGLKKGKGGGGGGAAVTAGKKESMFRTGEGVNARVGFTGSGREMRKDEKRARHVYAEGEEEEY